MENSVKNYFKEKALDQVKTPSFIYFSDQVDNNIQNFKSFAENGIDIFYAVKANNHIPMVKRFIKEGYGFDVASREEIEFLVGLGADASMLCFSAPTKIEFDIKYAAKVGVRYYAFDSESEMLKIAKLVTDPILIARISTPSKESAFDLSTKFGMTDKYFAKVLKVAKAKKIKIQGLTFHVGSQNTEVTSWKKALNMMNYLTYISNRAGNRIEILNIGGGIPAPYSAGIKTQEYFIDGITTYLKRFRNSYGFKQIIIEPGRSLSANTMAYVTRVVDIKSYKKPPTVVVDGSVFSGLIEPLEGFEYPIYRMSDILQNSVKESQKYYRIAGISCDGCDIIKQRTLLPKDLQIGDLLVIMYAGAYTFVYEDFHMRSFPTITE